VTQRPAEHFAELLRSFEAAMLVSLTREGQLQARPLCLAAVNDEGDVWLATGLDSGKAAEIFSGRPVTVVMQSAKRFVSITGMAEPMVDRAMAHALWNEDWRPWFPQGPDDDELGLLHLRATDARFWDLEDHRGFVYLFGAVRHAVRGERATPTSHDALHLDVREDDADRRPTLTGWLKSHLHGSARRARSESTYQSLAVSSSAGTVRPLESNAGDVEQTPKG
jgi:general stress protein 26